MGRALADQGEQLVTFAGIGACDFVGHAGKSGLACETCPERGG